MEKFKSVWKKFRSRLTIMTNRAPVLVSLGWLLTLNIIVALISALICFLVDSSSYGGYWGALRHAAQWIMFPSSVDGEAETWQFILGVVTGLVGIVIFSGTIIATMTNAIHRYVTKKTEAKGKLKLHGHYVILNYNSKVLAILVDMMHNELEETVVLLSDKNRDFIRAALASELAAVKQKPTHKLKLIVRQGDPFLTSELNDVSINTARGVLIMDKDYGAKKAAGISLGDYEVLKLVLNVAESNLAENCQIDVEAESYKTAQTIEDMKNTVHSLRGKHINAFSFNRKLGQFLALSVLCPQITGVLYELLSFSGDKFYSVDKIDTAQYLSEYADSIPVFTLSHSDKTYVLGDFDKRGNRRKTPYVSQKRIAPSKLVREKDCELFVIGNNAKSPYLFEALDAAVKRKELTVRTFSTDDLTGFTDALNASTHKEKVAVILSDDSVESQYYDANVFLTLMQLHNVYKGHPPFKVIAEILDPKNQPSIERFDVFNIIVSNRIVSFFATQTVTKLDSGGFYEELFTHFKSDRKHHFDIWVSQAKYLFDMDESLQFDSYAEFSSSAFHGSNKKILPFGRIEKGKNIFFTSDTDAARNLTVHKDDYICYVEYM